jgi:predicted aconitase with swiveling domain
MTETVFHAAAGMGRKVRATALVASDGFSARYDLDRIRGTFSRPEHKLAGESYVGRVLVLDAAKGGVATAWMLHEMKARGVMPAALVLNRANPIMVQVHPSGVIYFVILRCPRHSRRSRRTLGCDARASKDAAQLIRPSPFEGRFAAASG